jgi:hypothetical protein
MTAFFLANIFIGFQKCHREIYDGMEEGKERRG